MPMKENALRNCPCLLFNVTPLRHVKTVQEFSDILVADTADLLDISSAL
jgi:hypothetical protein